MRTARIGAIAAAGGLVACPAAVSLAQGRSLTPRAVLVSAHGTTVPASAGSYCVTEAPGPGSEEGRAECVDVVQATSPPRKRLTVQAGDLLHLRFQDNPATSDVVGSVRVYLTRIDGEGPRVLARMRPRRLRGMSDRWHVRLPARLRRANSLYLQVTFDAGGSSEYRGGLRALSPR